MVTGLCCATLLSGQFAQAAQPTLFTTARVADVALSSTGELHGQVLDAQGLPQSQVKVAVGRSNEQPTYVTTDAEGRFAVQGLSAGVYFVQTNQGSGSYRAWAPGTAPPSAQAGVLVVNNEQQVVRGFGPGHGTHLLANPWCMGLLVAAAIAIPLAIDSGS